MSLPGTRRSVRFIAAAAPLLLSMLLVPLLAGPLSFGGGEKDVLLAFPFLAWSVLYLVASLVLWWRRVPLGPTAAWAAGVATILCGVALVGLAALA